MPAGSERPLSLCKVGGSLVGLIILLHVPQDLQFKDLLQDCTDHDTVLEDLIDCIMHKIVLSNERAAQQERDLRAFIDSLIGSVQDRARLWALLFSCPRLINFGGLADPALRQTHVQPRHNLHRRRQRTNRWFLVQHWPDARRSHRLHHWRQCQQLQQLAGLKFKLQWV